LDKGHHRVAACGGGFLLQETQRRVLLEQPHDAAEALAPKLPGHQQAAAPVGAQQSPALQGLHRQALLLAARQQQPGEQQLPPGDQGETEIAPRLGALVSFEL